MRITYLDESIDLIDLPADIGYASEPVCLKDRQGREHTVGGMQRDLLQLVVALPNLSPPFAQMAQEVIDQVRDPEGIVLWLIQNRFGQERLELPQWGVELADSEGEFGGLYGLSVGDGLLEGALTPALYLISKDGAIFYREVPKVIPTSFNLERFNHEANRALHVYNGQGCHA